MPKTVSYSIGIMGKCKSCGRRLLLNPENELCISCESLELKEENERLKVEIERLRSDTNKGNI